MLRLISIWTMDSMRRSTVLVSERPTLPIMQPTFASGNIAELIE
jgi:hypothetical protein